MEVVIAFVVVAFVSALRRPEARTPRPATLLVLSVVVATALLSHKVA
jgi:hypothetical protein